MTNSMMFKILASFFLLLVVDYATASITVSIGNGLRITAGTQTRYRDPYKCYWDCDLVGCQLSRYDDECAYDCEKVCRSRYDYTGRSDPNGSVGPKSLGSETELNPKSAPVVAEPTPNNANDIKPNPTGEFSML